ncbi:hypothetical protein [Arthrobacter sp.]|uniref:hypothetical protein n=1 Tax=Arthrobacter sp. TaxID=1667 RepID=UPI003A952742
MPRTISTLTALALTSALLIGAGPANADNQDGIALTPEVSQRADRAALENPLTDSELARIADEAVVDAPPLLKREAKELKALAKGGELTAWAGGTEFKPQEEATAETSGTAARASKSATTYAYQAKVWGACGVTTPNSKLVRMFQTTTTPWVFRNVPMYCGTNGYGYRHIKSSHMRHWNDIAVLLGANWRDFADFAISDALDHMYSGAYSKKNDTYTYKGVVQLKRYDGKTVKTYYPRVVVAAGNYKMITAFPSSGR